MELIALYWMHGVENAWHGFMRLGKKAVAFVFVPENVGPENLVLEISTSDQAEHPLDLDGTWIDPEVVKLAGISPEELHAYQNPAAYESPAEPVPQPEYDPSKPHNLHPMEVYLKMLATPDAKVTARSSIIDPPDK